MAQLNSYQRADKVQVAIVMVTDKLGSFKVVFKSRVDAKWVFKLLPNN